MTLSRRRFNTHPHGSRIGNRLISFLTAASIPSVVSPCLAILLAMMALAGGASAQTSSNAILAPGNAIVTSFSGVLPPAEIAPGQDPGDLTFIDPKGPSAQVFNLQAPGAPPRAQVVGAPIPFTVTAAQVGQVLGVALDNAAPPNIYVAATSAYGLPIVVPGKGGAPIRKRQGTPGATFMNGLFGPGGGPGSIWRIDGISGVVSLFADVTQKGAANSGPALGGLAFDAVSNTLLVADRESGVIHRFNLSGTEIGQYDHGVQGLAAAGRPQVPYAPNQRDITHPNFASDNPASWGYAQPERRIFGLAVHGGRLYYAVAAGLQVWSVGLAADGSFGNDARMEVQAPQPAPREIATIAFDDRGDMILAERGTPTGDYEMTALTQAGVGRVLRYSPTIGSTGARISWQLEPDQYAIGFPLPFSNSNGGVAVGNGYAANGNLDPASCGGFLWSNGEDLRNTTNGGLLPDLAANGALNLNGLQGNGIDAVAPANVPPLLSYFVDYDAQFDDPAIRGYLGEIAISRPCFQQAVLPRPAETPGSDGTPPTIGGAATPSGGPSYPPPLLLPTGIPPKLPLPSGSCPGGVVNSAAGGCCPSGSLVNPITGACQPNCPPGQPRNPITNQCCPSGTTPQLNGTCVPTPSLPLTGCQVLGETTFCSNLDLGINVQCPAGQAMPNGLCCPSSTKPTALGCMATSTGCGGGGIASLCCPTGRAANFANNSCCQIGQTFDAKSGQCVTPPTPPPPPPPPFTCPVGSTIYCEAQANPNCQSGESVPDGCCPSGSQANNGMCIATGPTACGPSIPSMCCPSGQVPDYLANACLTPPAPPATHQRATPRTPPSSGNTCALGYPKVGSGCCLTGQATSKGQCCPAGQTPNTDGVCKTVTRLRICPTGETLDLNGNTCLKLHCPAGETRGTDGVCACPSGQRIDATGKCVAACPGDEVINPTTGLCQYVSTALPSPPSCPSGQVMNSTTGKCEYISTTLPSPQACPSGEVINPDTGKCAHISTTLPTPLSCPSGEVMNPDTGKCEQISKTIAPTPSPEATRPCLPGETRDANGTCGAASEGPQTSCAGGSFPGTNGACETSCSANQTIGANGLCACAPGAQISAGIVCCPDGMMADSGGKCQPICKNGATDPASVALCLYGYNPVPKNGVYSCANGAAATTQPNPGLGGCLAQSPLTEAANCPQGTALRPDASLGVPFCQPTPQELLCERQGMHVGLDGQCQNLCAAGTAAYPNIQCCPAGQVAQGGRCIAPARTCPPGEVEAPNGKCAPAPGTTLNLPVPPPAAGCAVGYTMGANGMCIRNSVVCPPRTGEVPGPHGACVCPTGSTLGPTGACVCANGDLANGRECGPAPARPCPPDQKMSNGGCCPNGSMALPGGGCSMVCTPGQVQEPNGNCGPIPTPPPSGGCPSGEVANPAGGCLPGTFVPPTSQPIPPSIPRCPPSVAPGANGCRETPPQEPPCAAGFERNAAGACVSAKKQTCPEGKERNANGACVSIRKLERPASPRTEKQRISPKSAIPRLAPQKVTPKFFTNKRRG